MENPRYVVGGGWPVFGGGQPLKFSGNTCAGDPEHFTICLRARAETGVRPVRPVGEIFMVDKADPPRVTCPECLEWIHA